MERTVLYIEVARPRAFIIENVVGLMTLENGSYFASLVERVSCGGAYCVQHAIFKSLDYHLPQSRRRATLWA